MSVDTLAQLTSLIPKLPSSTGDKLMDVVARIPSMSPDEKEKYGDIFANFARKIQLEIFSLHKVLGGKNDSQYVQKCALAVHRYNSQISAIYRNFEDSLSL